WWRMPFLFLKGRKEMAQYIDQIPIFKEMDDLLRALYANGNQLFIISSNSDININHFLDRYNLKQYITKVYGGAGVFGKTPLLKRAIKEYNIETERCWYIGDEVRDIKAARRAGIQAIAVTWGYNNAEILYKQKPTKVAFTPEDIRKVLSVN